MAVSGFAALSGSAYASTVDIEATANEPITVVSTPADDLATATSISVASWTTTDVTGFTISSPITISDGSKITVTWSGGFTDTLTITGTDVFDHTLDIVAIGVLSGPGVPADNSSELDLSFTQSRGTGHTISGSATYTDVGIVPEPATWAMMMLGFAGLGYAAFRRNAKAGTAATAI